MTRVQFWPLLLVALSMFAILSTYTRLSRTADETFHISCGLEWWQKHAYTIHPTNPPLTRMVLAAPTFFAQGLAPDLWNESTPREAYIGTTWLMRVGNLPFYLLNCWLVVKWAKRLFGSGPSLCALALLVSLATFSAQAGLATTDTGYATMFLWALIAGIDWLKQPGFFRSSILGISTGMMIGAKFPGLVQWPVAMLLILFAQGIANYREGLPFFALKWRHALTACLVALPWAALTVGVIYQFSFQPLWQGLEDAQHFNQRGFSLWLFHRLPVTGVWYFFPVIFFFKTPLPFHIFTVLGNARIVRSINLDYQNMEQLFPLLAAIAVLGTSMTGHVNLGVRHVLALYPLLTIPAGYALHCLWKNKGWQRLLAGVMLLWQLGGYLHSYPDLISYFNATAGDHPEQVSIDSDFDWGQGILQLDKVLQARGINELYVCPREIHISATNVKILLHAHALPCPDKPVNGWIAMSLATELWREDDFAWLSDDEAVQRIGKTMVLYHVPAP